MKTFLERNKSLLLSLCLCVSVAAAYWGVWNHRFVAWDDNYNVYDNPRVVTGLSPANAKWAMTSMEGANWFPAMWISLMAFGNNSRSQHLFNLALHAANTVLVFLILLRLFPLPYSLFPSFAAAAIFALHPLRAESVAWVSVAARIRLLMPG
jgi:hypothetical protein